MNIRELNKPINSKTLNETLSKKFGTKINVEKFTLEQLQDARNKIRTKLSDIETNESFAGLSQNETYSKNKLFLDVLNAAISERSDVDEAAKPDYIDIDGDGDKKEPMKKAVKDKKTKGLNKKANETAEPNSDGDLVIQMLKFAAETAKKNGDMNTYNDLMKEIAKRSGGVPAPDKPFAADDEPNTDMPDPERPPMAGLTQLPGQYDDPDGSIRDRLRKMAGESIVREGEEDKAELVMAAKDMVDRLTGWMEDTAEMQSESMLELADAIRDEMGAQQSEQFTATVKPALEQLYSAMESTRVSLTQGVGMLTGEAETAEPMGAEPAAEPNIDMEPTVDTDDVADDFAAAEAAVGGEDEAGRAKRESINLSRRLGTILSSKQ